MDVETLQMLLGSVRKWGKTKQQREELFTVCLEAYYLKLVDKSVDTRTFYNYVSVMFRNTCIDYLRTLQRRSKEVLFCEMAEGFLNSNLRWGNPHDNTNIYVMFEEFDKTLSDDERKLVEMLMLDYTYEEIATELDIPLGTVKTRIFRYRAKWSKIPQLASLGE
jgi:RNA polymerase sigma factor (sigma-70 family)